MSRLLFSKHKTVAAKPWPRLGRSETVRVSVRKWVFAFDGPRNRTTGERAWRIPEACIIVIRTVWTSFCVPWGIDEAREDPRGRRKTVFVRSVQEMFSNSATVRRKRTRTDTVDQVESDWQKRYETTSECRPVGLRDLYFSRVFFSVRRRKHRNVNVRRTKNNRRSSRKQTARNADMDRDRRLKHRAYPSSVDAHLVDTRNALLHGTYEYSFMSAVYCRLLFFLYTN